MLRLATGVALAVLLGACSPGAETAAPAAADNGRYKADLEMKELMAHVIDYNADGIWLNQGWIINETGTHELFPSDDAGWHGVESAAASLAESSNLLILPSRAVDDEQWVEYAHRLHDRSMDAMKAAEARDKQAFFDAGGAIYVVCRDCHARYILGEEPPIEGPAPRDPTAQ
jgi:hypothetical protein